MRRLRDSLIDDMFRAACEATEEAVLNAMCAATTISGRDGRTPPLLGEWLDARR